MVPHVTKDTNKSAMNLISSSNMMLREGEYMLKVVAKDANNPSRRDSVQLRLPIKLPASDKLVVSDIEFASNIKRGKQGNPFYKNTLEVIPNVDGVYSDEQKCFYYAEAYNLLAGDSKDDFTVKATIYNAIGKEVISRERPRKRSAESTVLVDNFEVANLRSGTYTLVLSLQDSAKKTLANTGKKFFVYNSVLGVDSSLLKLDPAISLSVYSAMEEPEMDREFKWTKWEAQESEKQQYESLQGVAAKRKFLTEFWTRRPVGLREQYFQRVTHANSTYNVLGMEGYRTDRGRVSIIYGNPDDIERHPNEAGTRPYEIWYFNNIQGGVQFVFVLRQNGGDYELVHSTHRNELHDENWARYAQTN
jgi:GWxTD domain-containing protein